MWVFWAWKTKFLFNIILKQNTLHQYLDKVEWYQLKMRIFQVLGLNYYYCIILKYCSAIFNELDWWLLVVKTNEHSLQQFYSINWYAVSNTYC